MTDNAHIIDHDTLAALQEVMEDDFIQLLETFISDSEARMDSLQSALVAGDAEQVRRAAHSFKGSCSNIGAERLMQQCLTIEQSAARDELGGLERALVDLHGEFNQVTKKLDVYL